MSYDLYELDEVYCISNDWGHPNLVREDNSIIYMHSVNVMGTD